MGAIDQRKKGKEQIEILLNTGSNMSKVSFLLDAIELVIECRRVLKWTYVCGFAMTSESERRLFEYKQSDLEEYTEKLNQLAEGSLAELQKNKSNVLNWTTAL